MKKKKTKKRSPHFNCDIHRIKLVKMFLFGCCAVAAATTALHENGSIYCCPIVFIVPDAYCVVRKKM